jgi:hypothetical protein
MLFGRDPRKKAVVDRALEQVRKILLEMEGQGKDLTRIRFKKYQKTHYTTCTCAQCLEADRSRNPHKRGLLEDGYKLYVGPGSEEED